ncbi:hypothetical protein LTR27_011844 [Elasticomyces elasticus]|nr:hypothetical protein LTR27_011844 [Elasticomyces elasticus]
MRKTSSLSTLNYRVTLTTQKDVKSRYPSQSILLQDIMAAAKQVFTLPELLEITLLHLPTRDLLFAQKVCRAWKTAIDTTTSIQKALYLLPGTVADVRVECPDHAFMNTKLIYGNTINPLLVCIVANTREVRFLPTAVTAGPEASCHRMCFSQAPDGITICWGVRNGGVNHNQYMFVRVGDSFGDVVKKVHSSRARYEAGGVTVLDGEIELL